MVAEEIVDNPKLKPTTAIKHVLHRDPQPGQMQETVIRRLQGKWKDRGEALLQRVKAQRIKAAVMASRPYSSGVSAFTYSSMLGPGPTAMFLEKEYMKAQQLADEVAKALRFSDIEQTFSLQRTLVAAAAEAAEAAEFVRAEQRRIDEIRKFTDALTYFPETFRHWRLF
jgi:hypothetical protein